MPSLTSFWWINTGVSFEFSMGELHVAGVFTLFFQDSVCETRSKLTDSVFSFYVRDYKDASRTPQFLTMRKSFGYLQKMSNDVCHASRSNTNIPLTDGSGVVASSGFGCMPRRYFCRWSKRHKENRYGEDRASFDLVEFFLYDDFKSLDIGEQIEMIEDQFVLCVSFSRSAMCSSNLLQEIFFRRFNDLWNMNVHIWDHRKSTVCSTTGFDWSRHS